MLKFIRENPRAFFFALIIHLGLLAVLLLSVDWSPEPSSAGKAKPAPIQAVVIDANRLDAEVQRQKAAQEKKRQAELARLEKLKRQADEARRKAEAKKKAEAEARRKAAAEAKRKAEAEARRKAEEAARRKAAEQALQASLAAERERLAAQQRVVDEYVQYIREKVQRSWIKPPGAGSGLSCVVEVRLIPGGEVVDAQIVRGSGDPAFDRSVEAAVFKASPLPVPADPDVMDRFRSLRFEFRPG